MQKFKFNRQTLKKLKSILKRGLVVTKLAAIGTALTGAVTAITTSMSAGFAMTAAGATTYAAAKNIPIHGYDKTKHIPPVAPKAEPTLPPRQVEMLRAKKKKSKGKTEDAFKPEPARFASKAIMRKRT